MRRRVGNTMKRSLGELDIGLKGDLSTWALTLVRADANFRERRAEPDGPVATACQVSCLPRLRLEARRDRETATPPAAYRTMLKNSGSTLTHDRNLTQPRRSRKTPMPTPQ